MLRFFSPRSFDVTFIYQIEILIIIKKELLRHIYTILLVYRVQRFNGAPSNFSWVVLFSSQHQKSIIHLIKKRKKRKRKKNPPEQKVFRYPEDDFFFFIFCAENSFFFFPFIVISYIKYCTTQFLYVCLKEITVS